MIIKICGLQREEEVKQAAQSGASHLGFVFSSSKRQVDHKKVEEITKNLPQGIKKVGIFVDEDYKLVNEISDLAGLDVVQLHGQEDLSYIDKIDLPVIKALDDYRKLGDYRSTSKEITFLLDGRNPGSGQSFDWENFPLEQLEEKFILAGGLNLENIDQALEHFSGHLIGVDVSSGVESSGQKDLQKIDLFIRKVMERKI
ncbi:phosphoribosylanthranilate isomerase [Streptococcaceae bacterium ESL0729]|nr:phosphoribosylanthranilate isomerase [Streptococcaceae bacterium ESL0729]